MSSLGTLQVAAAEPAQINDALSQTQQRIDALKGLSGAVELFNALTVRTSVRVLDSTGTLLHAFGVAA